MFYLLQEGLFKSYNEAKLLRCLDRFCFEYEVVKVRPFIYTIEFTTDRKDVICFGSITMGMAAKKYNWIPGSFYNDNHDYEIYSKYYKEHLLNYDSQIVKLKDTFEVDGDSFFARPCADSKLFKSKVYTKQSWAEFINDLEGNYVSIDHQEDHIQICSPKEIFQEYRCWIVNGKCITISMYKLGSQVVYENHDYNEEILTFAATMIEIYQPSIAFVMDICLSANGLKIVEINCLNHAGFYDCNIQKLIEALEDNFNTK